MIRIALDHGWVRHLHQQQPCRPGESRGPHAHSAVTTER